MVRHQIDRRPTAVVRSRFGNIVPPSSSSSPSHDGLGTTFKHDLKPLKDLAELSHSARHDRYTEVAELIDMASTKQRKYQNSLPRLWWCCVITDRISPLCTRFSLYITHDRFDFKNTIPLGAEHLQDDIYRSSVFTPATKRRQIGIFSKYLELVILLTDVLTLVYPFEASVKSKSRSAEDEDLAFEKCETALKAWHVRVSAQFPPFENAPQESCGKGNDQDKSIVLQTNLMSIYCRTASIALCHSKILRQSLTFDSVGGDIARPGRSLKIQQSSFEVQSAAHKITECYEELTHRRLARWLPISALACLATSLTLHTITARLSSLSNELTGNGSIEAGPTPASNQDQLKVLVDTMNAFFPQYYGVDWPMSISGQREFPDRLESDFEKPAEHGSENDLNSRCLHQQRQAAGRIRLPSLAALLVQEEQRIKDQTTSTVIYD
ncbi:Cutinase transcription factor 1 beta [Fusarium acutatum]|uniref:Cutinase transcription factor 1 beta n=1 Tax=Fusarium acutatum TaxID=78861 RepID=A0A8H4K4Q9_9HYPO|nr:Cutinase transcription factor 1 beta [Fusarium acutatum]